MSDLLHSALHKQMDEAEKRMAHGITRVGPVKVAGKHLSAAPNEPFAVSAAKQELACIELQVQRMRNAGAL